MWFIGLYLTLTAMKNNIQRKVKDILQFLLIKNTSLDSEDFSEVKILLVDTIVINLRFPGENLQKPA